ncbi:anti-repressor SinI family protein [Priestia megaterium]|jgi:DNA-binding transcriptional MerR regulator|nr:anti-repressor SinI family protein [Priestia megaterium]MCY9017887.1 anti-repressor SinI family protein [Priestia megaterium]
MNTNEKLAVDQEWIDLLKAAHELGLKIEEVREFLLTNKNNQ